MGENRKIHFSETRDNDLSRAVACDSTAILEFNLSATFVHGHRVIYCIDIGSCVTHAKSCIEVGSLVFNRRYAFESCTSPYIFLTATQPSQLQAQLQLYVSIVCETQPFKNFRVLTDMYRLYLR